MRALNTPEPVTTTRRPAATHFTIVIGLGLLLLVDGGRDAAAQDHAGQYERADIEFGARLYNANCTRCHAESGDAVAGVDLLGGQYGRAGSDFELMRLLRTGVPGTAMPPNDFSTAELTGLVAFLRTMRDFDVSSVHLGDVTRGGGLFRAKGACATCHRVNGNGPRTAPDLSGHRRHPHRRDVAANAARPDRRDAPREPARSRGDKRRHRHQRPPAERGYLHGAAD